MGIYVELFQALAQNMEKSSALEGGRIFADRIVWLKIEFQQGMGGR